MNVQLRDPSGAVPTRRFHCLIVTMLAAWAGAVSSPAAAHEGMWTPQQLPQIADELQRAGLELDPSALTDLTGYPMGAVVSLGGCSGSFVTPRGLVATNHHCVYGSLQYNSSAEKNLLQNGFIARTQEDELPAAPGSRVYVTIDVQDVTDRVLDAKTARLGGARRTAAMERNQKALIADCERDAGHRCAVASFHGGVQFQLIKALAIRDVRLVYAPPEGVGKFGGDTDNWMWPRHTGDFSFYRAYVGPDGKPADFSRENVPYEPRHHLKLATQGLKEGDFVMVAGYPGRTSRYALPSEVEFTFAWRYPRYIELAGEQLAIIERETRGREAAQIAYANTVAAINNFHKNTQGMLASYQGSSLLEQKRREAEAMKAWVQADAGRRGEYAADIAAVEGLLERRDATVKREYLLDYATARLLGAARMLHQLAHEKSKPDDAQRKPGFQERDWPMLRQSLEMIDKRYDAQVDKALVEHFLRQYLALPQPERNETFLAALGIGEDTSAPAIRAALDRLYAGSRLADRAARLSWLERDVAAFEASDDAFIRAAVALYADDNRRERRDKALGGDLQRAYTGYMKAFLAYRQSRGEVVYPDANSTLRITFGQVAGRTPGHGDGTAWTAFTTLEGVAAKHTNEGEFDAPDAQLEAIEARRYARYADSALGTVPVNFLATLDITGGNSGSAVLNSRAELVGLAFDGTLDSVISNWSFDPRMTRTIAVDLRYMLWYMDVIDRADELLSELGVESRKRS